jgi:hypothetical protein
MSHFFEFPFDTATDLLIQFHGEVVRSKRKDLIPLSRLTTVICLN